MVIVMGTGHNAEQAARGWNRELACENITFGSLLWAQLHRRSMTRTKNNNGHPRAIVSCSDDRQASVNCNMLGWGEASDHINASPPKNLPPAASVVLSPHCQLPDVSGGTVSVLVGKETFHVHQTVLVGSSMFFQNAMKPEWRTDLTKPIDLADADPVLFKAYSQWLYTKQAPELVADYNYLRLAELYVFGERIMDEAFKQAMLRAIMNEANDKKARAPSLESIRIIYAGTQANDPARRLIVDISVYRIDTGARRIRNADSSVDGEYMKDFLTALVEHCMPVRGRKSRPWVTNPNSYLSKTEEAKNDTSGSETSRHDDTAGEISGWGRDFQGDAVDSWSTEGWLNGG
ncbi:hypothetical protein FB567DRAFT_543264 [Paraphoma chrysanthemicola]|uniref:BTB domain-containing protein n=1 Tax=Paraphoma chrysanthemicola TaxID=798071 RepID=A0A8K0RH04_9PLEO|nr:hypothetical protein FB567DRAFT_543264 [Paraphoma chrysanthemicola]